MPLGTEVDLSSGYTVLDEDLAPLPSANGAQQPPLFSPCLLWPRSPISAFAELLLLTLLLCHFTVAVFEVIILGRFDAKCKDFNQSLDTSGL